MQENKFIKEKKKQQQKPKILLLDIVLILSFIIGFFITTELFQIGFYIKCNLIQTILIYVINVPTFTYIIIQICMLVLINGNKNYKKRG